MLRRGVLGIGLVLALGCSGLDAAIQQAAESMQPSPPPLDRLDYVGTWEGEGTTLTIHSDGMLDYAHQEGGTSTSFNAPIQRWEDGAIVSGIGPIEKTLVVQAPPRQEDGTWIMIVDGRRLVRQ